MCQEKDPLSYRGLGRLPGAGARAGARRSSWAVGNGAPSVEGELLQLTAPPQCIRGVEPFWTAICDITCLALAAARVEGSTHTYVVLRPPSRPVPPALFVNTCGACPL